MSLGLSSDRHRSQQHDAEPAPPLNFRDIVVWYPDIPDPAFRFLGTSGQDWGRLNLPELDDGNMAIFLPFGGNNGKDLTRITFRRSTYEGSADGLDMLVIASQCQTLQGEMITRHMGHEAAGLEFLDEHFEIDGPGGERITGFESVYFLGDIQAFRVSLTTPPPPHNLSQGSEPLGRFLQIADRRLFSPCIMIFTSNLPRATVTPDMSRWRRGGLLVSGVYM